MSKKLTYMEIENRLNSVGYKLLDTMYKDNCLWKVKYICPFKHEHVALWTNWIQGHRCPYCARNAKPTIEFIRSEFKKENYKLLTTEYVNAYQKLDYICPQGHKYSIRWNDWHRNHRCPYCEGNARLTIEFIRFEFKKEGYKLLSNKYVNAFQKLNYICPKGHKASITWSNWRHDKRCPICKAINMSGPNHPMWKGGIACEPYCPIWLDKKFKESILERDNYQCQNPDCWGTSEKICGHHIDYDKKNCDPSNIIIVCNSCNVRANKDREYWMEFYQEIMNKKYGYSYGN